jgi:hypothetical protein
MKHRSNIATLNGTIKSQKNSNESLHNTITSLESIKKGPSSDTANTESSNMSLRLTNEKLEFANLTSHKKVLLLQNQLHHGDVYLKHALSCLPSYHLGSQAQRAATEDFDYLIKADKSLHAARAHLIRTIQSNAVAEHQLRERQTKASQALEMSLWAMQNWQIKGVAVDGTAI